jgi:hypothetical protein
MSAPGVTLPPGTREVILGEDADNKDPPSAAALMARAAARFRAEGLTVRAARPPESQDFNRLLMGAA